MKKTVEIIFEDDDLIIVNKPHDFLSIPDRFSKTIPNVYQVLNEKYGKVFIVHRIDKETSGIMCFAKNEAAHRNLSQQFENRVAEKFYYTLVRGQMHQDQGSIDKPIAPSETQPGKMMISKKGKDSLTLFKVIEKFRSYSLIEAEIKTGRTHQIRVHFQSIGYPLAVDPLYSPSQAFMLSDIKTKSYRVGKFQEEERPLMTRTTLHAYRLRLKHPTTGEYVEFTADLPKDFNAVVTQLRKCGK